MDYPLKLDNAPSVKAVFSPVNVSILSSVGLHAFLLGLALPNLHWGGGTEKEIPIQETVGVIELTPAEQNRLPNPSLSTPGGAILPGVAPTPPDSTAPSSTSILPPSNYNPLPPVAPTLPALPSLPPYPNLPPLQSYGTLRNFPVVNPPLAALPPLRPSRFSNPRLPSVPQNFSTSPQGLAGEMSPGLRPQFSPLSPPRGTDFITRAPVHTPLGPSPSPQLEDYGIDTPLAMARDNDLTWQAKRGTTIKERIAIAGPYPPIACRNRTAATVVYNADGEGNVDLISASRYPIFNQLAQQVIAGRSFSEPTQISVVFNYDPRICGGGEAPIAPAPTNPELARPGVPQFQPPATLPQPQGSEPTPAPRPPVELPNLSPSPSSPPPQAPPATPAPAVTPPVTEPEPQALPPRAEPNVVNTPAPVVTPPVTEPATPRLPSAPESKQEQLRLQQQRRLPLAPPSTPTPAAGETTQPN